MTPAPLEGLAFVAGAGLSLAASAVLVARLERVCARLGLSAALLGLITALAADTPEITSAVTALAQGQRAIGTGVILGSNVFNLAALIGLGAVVAGGIALHRRAVLLEGAMALWIAAVTAALVTGLIPAGLALALALVVFAPYVYLAAAHPTGPAGRSRAPVPARVRDWLAVAVTEEEQDLAGSAPPGRGGARDAGLAVAALAVVLAASAVMEQSAASLGPRLGVPDAVTGTLVLAAVTSLPNAVAAIYLARRGHASATLSEALNSNTLNVLAGLLLPAVIAPAASLAAALGTTAWYGALTLATVAIALAGRGVSRRSGLLIIYAYAVFAVTVAVTASR